MSNQVLRKLLHAGLLSALGDDDQRRERAEAASDRVAEWLGSDGRSQLAASLIHSIDESITTINHPVLRLADECLLEQWPSFRNAFAEPPAELLRATVFQAAISAAASDPTLEAVLSYVLRTAETLKISVGRWQEVVRGEAERINTSVEKRLEATWLPSPATGKLRMPPMPALEESGDESSDLRAFAEKVGGNLRSQLEAQWAVVGATQLRERLLWWHLAAYSETLKMRYVEVEATAIRCIAAAVDVWKLSPAIAPRAVEHLLTATVDSTCERQVAVSFVDLVEAWQQLTSDHEFGVVDGGLVLAALSSGDASVTGSTLPETLTACDVAAIVYRDLQVLRLLNETNS